MGQKTSKEVELGVKLKAEQSNVRIAKSHTEDSKREATIYKASSKRLQKHSDDQQKRIENQYTDLKDRRSKIKDLKRIIGTMKEKENEG